MLAQVAQTVPEWTPYVSVAALLVSLCAIAWQLALYRLSGARLKVRLRPAAYNVRTLQLSRGREKGWRDEPNPGFQEFVDFSPPTVSLALVQVVNVGRVAVSVENISLDFGRTSWRSRHRHTRVALPVAIYEGKGANQDPTQPVRLEPGGSYAIFFHVPDLIDEAEPNRSIRASATPVGRRTVRSPLRKRWKWRKRWETNDGKMKPWLCLVDRTPEQLIAETVFPLAIRYKIEGVRSAYMLATEWCESEDRSTSRLSGDLANAFDIPLDEPDYRLSRAVGTLEFIAKARAAAS